MGINYKSKNPQDGNHLHGLAEKHAREIEKDFPGAAIVILIERPDGSGFEGSFREWTDFHSKQLALMMDEGVGL